MILDMTCGSRMMWHQKSNPDTIYGDLRVESHTLSDGRRVDIKPDIRFDYRALPFPDNTFDLVNFDPRTSPEQGKPVGCGKNTVSCSLHGERTYQLGYRRASVCSARVAPSR